MMSRNHSTLFVPFALIFMLPLPAQAQPGPNCVECDITTETMTVYYEDQTVCPGKNAVVCDYDYDQNTASKCVAGDPNLMNCKPSVKKRAYPTITYAANVCGTDNGLTVTCPAPGGGPGPNENDDSHECDGTSWVVGMVTPTHQQFSLDVRVPQGLTALAEDTTSALQKTLIVIPAALIMTAVETLEMRNDDILVSLMLEPGFLSRFLIPDQAFAAVPVGGEPKVLSSTVHDGKVAIDLAISQSFLSAYEEYTVDVTGLNVVAGPLPKQRVASSSKNPNPTMRDPDSFSLLVEVTSAGNTLTSGAGVVGRLVQQPDSVDKPFSKLAAIFGILLLLSWVVFLLRRRKPV